jgi:hypothetical protein
MNKSAYLAVALAFLIVSSLFGVAAAGSLVVVKTGDWIKYQVTETGSVPSEFNITRASLDVIGVQGEKITINVVTVFGNGTVFPENGITLNLATGAVGDGFFIPLNLTVGDKYSTEYEGVVNMTGVGRMEAAGAERTVLLGTSSESTYSWDTQTGIMIAATSNLGSCTMHTRTSATNLWAPQILGLNQTVFYALVAAVIAIVALLTGVIAVLVLRGKKPSASPSS